MGLSGQKSEVKKRSLCIPPPGYVAGMGELIFVFVGILVMVGLACMMWGSLVEIPAVPKKMVLRNAYVTHALGMSKSTARLSIKVMRDQGGYDCSFDLPNDEVRLLNVKKFKKLWVAIEAGSDNNFVWAIYDDEFKLMVSRQQILRGVTHNNGAVYLVVVWTCLFVGYWIFNMFRCGVWNRFYYKKDG